MSIRKTYINRLGLVTIYNYPMELNIIFFHSHRFCTYMHIKYSNSTKTVFRLGQIVKFRQIEQNTYIAPGTYFGIIAIEDDIEHRDTINIIPFLPSECTKKEITLGYIFEMLHTQFRNYTEVSKNNSEYVNYEDTKSHLLDFQWFFSRALKLKIASGRIIGYRTEIAPLFKTQINYCTQKTQNFIDDYSTFIANKNSITYKTFNYLEAFLSDLELCESFTLNINQAVEVNKTNIFTSMSVDERIIKFVLPDEMKQIFALRISASNFLKT